MPYENGCTVLKDIPSPEILTKGKDTIVRQFQIFSAGDMSQLKTTYS
jgi:hypothetical protein